MSDLLSISDLKNQSHEDFQFLFRQKRFYKYVSFQVAKEIILPEQTLKFSPPEFFNDPFDCNEELLDIHMDETHIRGFAGEQLNKMPPVMQQFVIGRMLGGKAVHEALRNEKKNFKICCFSTRHDDTLMWSHYADKHTGICLGFEFPIRGDIFTLYPVRYIDEIRKLHGMADTATIFHYWLTRKPSCWAYENEIRAITRSGMELTNLNSSNSAKLYLAVRSAKSRSTA